MIYPTESQIQCAFFDWVRLQPKISPYCFHVPNGGYRNAREGAKFKREGVLSGIPDIVLALPSKAYHGLFLELKSRVGKLSKEQKSFLDRVRDVGYCAEVARSVDEAIGIVTKYWMGFEPVSEEAQQDALEAIDFLV